MKVQDYIIDQAKLQAEEAFRYAAAVPEDKLEWAPEGGRNVLDMCKEMAKCPDWAYQIIEPGGGFSTPSEEGHAAMRAEMDAWKTVQDCQNACFEKLDKLAGLYREISDEQFSETKWLPFNGGRDHTMLEMMDYPRWNFNYHLGQIGYIQTLYGDRDMH